VRRTRKDDNPTAEARRRGEELTIGELENGDRAPGPGPPPHAGFAYGGVEEGRHFNLWYHRDIKILTSQGF